MIETNSIDALHELINKNLEITRSCSIRNICSNGVLSQHHLIVGNQIYGSFRQLVLGILQLADQEIVASSSKFLDIKEINDGKFSEILEKVSQLIHNILIEPNLRKKSEWENFYQKVQDKKEIFQRKTIEDSQAFHEIVENISLAIRDTPNPNKIKQIYKEKIKPHLSEDCLHMQIMPQFASQIEREMDSFFQNPENLEKLAICHKNNEDIYTAFLGESALHCLFNWSDLTYYLEHDPIQKPSYLQENSSAEYTPLFSKSIEMVSLSTGLNPEEAERRRRFEQKIIKSAGKFYIRYLQKRAEEEIAIYLTNKENSNASLPEMKNYANILKTLFKIANSLDFNLKNHIKNSFNEFSESIIKLIIDNQMNNHSGASLIDRMQMSLGLPYRIEKQISDLYTQLLVHSFSPTFYARPIYDSEIEKHTKHKPWMHCIGTPSERHLSNLEQFKEKHPNLKPVEAYDGGFPNPESLDLHLNISKIFIDDYIQNHHSIGNPIPSQILDLGTISKQALPVKPSEPVKNLFSEYQHPIDSSGFHSATSSFQGIRIIRPGIEASTKTPYNEDTSCVVQLKDGILAGLFDGHGRFGYEFSNNARNSLLKVFEEQWNLWTSDGNQTEDVDIANTLYYTIIALHHQLICLQKKGGTTATVALLFKDKLYVANSGDSATILVYPEDDSFNYLTSPGDFGKLKTLQQKVLYKQTKSRKGEIRKKTGGFVSYIEKSEGKTLECTCPTFLGHSIAPEGMTPEPRITITQVSRDKDAFLALLSDGASSPVNPDYKSIATLISKLYKENPDRPIEDFSREIVNITVNQAYRENFIDDTTATIIKIPKTNNRLEQP